MMDILYGKVNTKFAYVWLVMKDDLYTLGAIASSYSVKLLSNIDRILLVTEDIEKKVLELAAPFFNVIIRVPYLSVDNVQLRTAKQLSMYKNWKDISITKWNCLALTQYEKILFIDADKIIFKNIDHLFGLDTPAGTFSSVQAFPYKGNGFYSPYINIPHGKIITPNLVEKGLYGDNKKGSHVVIATCILISPNKKDYLDYVAMTKEHLFFNNCNSMFDEQSISYFYSIILGKNWTQISQRYNYIPWHPEWLIKSVEKDSPPYLFHFFGVKPWILKRNEWKDLEVWYDYVKTLLNDKDIDKTVRAKLMICYRSEEVTPDIIKECCWCKSIGKECNHYFTVNGTVACPLLK